MKGESGSTWHVWFVLLGCVCFRNLLKKKTSNKNPKNTITTILWNKVEWWIKCCSRVINLSKERFEWQVLGRTNPECGKPENKGALSRLRPLPPWPVTSWTGGCRGSPGSLPRKLKGTERNTLKCTRHLSVHWTSERPNIILARAFHQLIMSFCRSTELRHFKLTVSCCQFGFCLCFRFNFTFCLKAQNHFLTIKIKQSSKTMVTVWI